MSMSNWTDDAINESSGLGFSRKWADLLYTCNDEDGPIYAAQPSTGDSVGTTTIRGVTLDDPESISVDFKGALWVADIGDNSETRDWVNVYTRGEPGPGFHRTLKFTHYRLDYPSGTSHNAETFLTWPDGKRQIISKNATGSVYQLPTKLETGDTVNRMTSVFGPSAALDTVTDGCVSKDGRWIFLLREGHGTTIYVFNTSWSQVGTITMSSMDKPEGITVTANGKALWVCDDNSRSSGGKLQKVNIPGAWCPPGATHYDDDSTVTGADPAPALPVNPCAA